MKTTRASRWTPIALALAVSVGASPSWAGGFSIWEQGSKALGMAGAFVAQADDPSALFYNVGGLAFVEKQEVAVGLTLVTSTDEEFVGLPPGSAQGTTGSLESLREPVPHVYWVRPGERWNWGVALNSPYGLSTDWRDPDGFAGRYINTEASLLVVDVSPNVGVQLTDRLGLGIGAIVRLSRVELDRRLPSFDPAAGQVVDVASAHLESDLERDFGWQIGLLYRQSDRFSWGFAYRSGIETEFAGDGVLTAIPTGNAGLDALIRATLPLDQELAVATAIEFPDHATLGAAFGLGRSSLIEVDVTWSGWSSFDRLPIVFPDNPEFDVVRLEEWDDSYTYRVGVLFGRGSDSEWRFGVSIDESPQPSRSVSPLLPDADRNGYTVGWGRRGERLTVDLALVHLDFDDRVTLDSIDGFNGRYSQDGWLLSATLGF